MPAGRRSGCRFRAQLGLVDLRLVAVVSEALLVEWFSEYDLTRIYMLGYMSIVESSFAIVAEPNRRAILSLLLSSERSVGEIERELRLSQPSVSKHLRVLREAGFVNHELKRSGACID